MSSLVMLLATSAHALDCTGLDPDLCAAANAAADQINAAAGYPIVYDEHPYAYRRPQYLYNRFANTALPRAQAECGLLEFRIEGTIGGHWDRNQYGPRNWHGLWADLDGEASGGIFMGSWDSQWFWGSVAGEHPQLDYGYHASWERSEMWMDLPEGYGGGFKRWLGNRDGYIANFYGSCVVPTAEDVYATYEVVGNTALVAGMQGYGEGEIAVPDGVFGTDLVHRVLAVTDGTTICPVDGGEFTCTSAQGGLLFGQEDGSFAYLPPVGAPNGTVDSFDVIAENMLEGTTTVGRVELTQVARVWYVEEDGNGDGSYYDPVGGLEAITGQVADGDVVYVGGAVPVGDGLTFQGEVSIVGGNAPLALDVSLNGVPAPVEIDMSYDNATLLAGGAPIATFDTYDVPGGLRLQSLDVEGDSGPGGMVTVVGDLPYAVDVDQVQVGGTGTFVKVDQPTAYVDDASAIDLRDTTLIGPMRIVDLAQGGQANTLLSIDNVQADLFGGQLLRLHAGDQAQLTVSIEQSQLESTDGVELVLDGDSQTQVDASYTQAVAFGGDLLAITSTGSSELSLSIQDVELMAQDTVVAVDLDGDAGVHLDASAVFADAGAQVLRVENFSDRRHVGPGFGAYISDSVLGAGGQTGRSVVEIIGRFHSESRLAMGGNEVYFAGPSYGVAAVQVHGDHSSTSAVTMLGNYVEMQNMWPAVDIETLYGSNSEMCLDFQDNDLRYSHLSLQQFQGTQFELAIPSSYVSNAYSIEHYLQMTNGYSQVEVERHGPGVVVDYAPTSGCALP